MASQRVGGTIHLAVNGETLSAKGAFSYDLGGVKREAVVGSDGIHGYKETHKPAYIEGEVTDRGTLDIKALKDMVDVTVTLELANGKTVVQNNSWYAAEGKSNSDEGNVDLRFEAAEGHEI